MRSQVVQQRQDAMVEIMQLKSDHNHQPWQRDRTGQVRCTQNKSGFGHKHRVKHSRVNIIPRKQCQVQDEGGKAPDELSRISPENSRSRGWGCCAVGTSPAAFNSCLTRSWQHHSYITVVCLAVVGMHVAPGTAKMDRLASRWCSCRLMQLGQMPCLTDPIYTVLHVTLRIVSITHPLNH